MKYRIYPSFLKFLAKKANFGKEQKYRVKIGERYCVKRILDGFQLSEICA
jgi:hypothetical protein